MHRVLFVLPNLSHNGTTKQLSLLFRGLLRTKFELSACALGPAGPALPFLQDAGVDVELLHWKRLFDVNPVLRLRTLRHAYRPDLLHVWQRPSLRAVWLAGGCGSSRLVVSGGLSPSVPAWERLDRWLIRRADRVIASHPREAERYRSLGLRDEQVALIPPAAALPKEPEGTRVELFRSLSLPDEARLLVCVGPLEPAKGFQDAIWAFDILRYLYNDLHLVLVGEGSDRARLEQFARVIQARRSVQFVGVRTDVPGLLAQAEIVWVPGHTHAGVNVALEAMAAGRPVVAARLPALADVVADNESGFLTAPGDKAELARQTRVLLDDAERRARMGQAGRQRIEMRFEAGHLVRAYTQLYEAVLAER